MSKGTVEKKIPLHYTPKGATRHEAVYVNEDEKRLLSRYAGQSRPRFGPMGLRTFVGGNGESAGGPGDGGGPGEGGAGNAGGNGQGGDAGTSGGHGGPGAGGSGQGDGGAGVGGGGGGGNGGMGGGGIGGNGEGNGGGNGEGNGGGGIGGNGESAGGPGDGGGPGEGGTGEESGGDANSAAGDTTGLGQDEGSSQSNANAKGDAQSSTHGKNSASPGPSNPDALGRAFGQETASVAQGLSAVSGLSQADSPSNMGVTAAANIGKSNVSQADAMAAAIGLHAMGPTDVPSPDAPANTAAPTGKTRGISQIGRKSTDRLGQRANVTATDQAVLGLTDTPSQVATAMNNTIAGLVAGKTTNVDSLGPLGAPTGMIGTSSFGTPNAAAFGRAAAATEAIGQSQSQSIGDAAQAAVGSLGTPAGVQAMGLADPTSIGSFGHSSDDGDVADSIGLGKDQGRIGDDSSNVGPPGITGYAGLTAPPGMDDSVDMGKQDTEATPGLDIAVGRVADALSNPGLIGLVNAINGKQSQDAVSDAYGGMKGGEGNYESGNSKNGSGNKDDYQNPFTPDWWHKWRADYGKMGLLGPQPYPGLLDA